jgi:hypothetical protein
MYASADMDTQLKSRKRRKKLRASESHHFRQVGLLDLTIIAIHRAILVTNKSDHDHVLVCAL